MKTNNKIGWKLFNFRCPKDVYEYFKEKSRSDYLSMTDYLIQLIVKDRKNNQDKNDIK